MATYYVGVGGNDTSDGLSWANRKLTLNGAEDIPVAAGDTVYVGPGTYREMLIVDVSGTAGNVISYIGDYDGTHTDGVGGVVRITGSNDDITKVRSACITVNNTERAYRTFKGFVMDMATAWTVNANPCGAGWIIEDCAIRQDGGISTACIIFGGANQATATVRDCLIDIATYGNYGVQFYHSAGVSNTGHVIENCIFRSSYYALPIIVQKIGGITIRNSHITGGFLRGVSISAALAAGQTVMVNNCVIEGGAIGLYASATGQIIEDYNAIYGVQTARTNVDVGAHSNVYPYLPDMRWFCEAVNAGDMLTPYDMASYCRLVDVAGTSPTTADLRGTTVQGTQREWGALEYDSALLIEDSGGVEESGGGPVRILPIMGGIG